MLTDFLTADSYRDETRVKVAEWRPAPYSVQARTVETNRRWRHFGAAWVVVDDFDGSPLIDAREYATPQKASVVVWLRCEPRRWSDGKEFGVEGGHALAAGDWAIGGGYDRMAHAFAGALRRLGFKFNADVRYRQAEALLAVAAYFKHASAWVYRAEA